MTRKLAAMFLLSFLIVAFVATSTAFSADKQLKSLQDRASIPARLGPVYSFPGTTGNETWTPPAPPQRNLRGQKAGEALLTDVGVTTYDYQHNCSMGRQVEHRAGYTGTPYSTYVHFDWMAQASDSLGVGRGVGYQAYEIAACSEVFGPGGIRIEADFAGYVNMDAHNLNAANSWAIPTAHQQAAGIYNADAYFDFQAGGPVFGVFTSENNQFDRYGYYQNNGTGPGNENIWPIIEWDIDGSEYVLHMVTTESGGGTGDPQTFSYYRRTGPYGTGQGVWAAKQRLIDSSMNINVTVTSSPISDKVAIVWDAPVDYLRDTPNEFVSQYENDIWFAIATDNGASWASSGPSPSIGNTVDLGIGGGYVAGVGGNLTLYNPLDDYKAYCDISAIWSITDAPNDYLNIVWGCRRWTDTTSLYRRQGAMFHWNQKTDVIRTVVKADWDTGGACYGHAWGTDVAKMTISECDGKMYICYTQFGSKDNPCLDVDNVNNVVDGYLYLTVFDPIYDAWDRAQRVTSTAATPTGCTPGTMAGPGTCNSEYWSSMARYGRTDTCKTSGDVLDILYINDYAPGGCVQTESGVWTINPVRWAVYPCREAVPEPGYSDDAGPGYGLCVGEPILVLGTTDNMTFTLGLENFGILDNDFSIVASIDSSNGGSNGGNTTIGVNPASGTILGAGGTNDITVTLTTAGEDDETTVYGKITVTHEAEGSPRVIPVCLTVSDSYKSLQEYVLMTACKSLRVYNNGQMSNNAINAGMDYFDPPDADDCANIYLYDASPIICRDIGGTMHCYFAAYDNAYASEHALRQVSDLVTDEVSYTDYTYATANFITGDSAIGMTVEYFAPKANDGNCEYIIQKLKVYNLTEVTMTGVAIGEVLDWDIPSLQHGSNNYDGFDATRNLVYQTCAGDTLKDGCDTLVTCQRYGGIAAWEGTPFKNYMVLENEIYVYTSGPFANDAPLPSDTTFGLMNGNDGYVPCPSDTLEDLFTLTTFGVYDLGADTVCVVKILVSSERDAGGANMAAAVDAANLFIANHVEIQCPIVEEGCEGCLPGDANNDGSVNVGDAVYTISYVFKGGPAPTPWSGCSGDANGDCTTNVGDAVYTISYVFKGGPPPVTPSEHAANCLPNPGCGTYTGP